MTTVDDKENMEQRVAAGGKRNIAAQDALLSRGELKMMLGQCLKMASENKITAHNTWGLPLIEHLDDLIQEEGHAGRNTNFQKASVTLDAGVKIYSYRVDSVHTETFKMLGGLGRASGPEEDGQQEGELGDGGVGQASPSKRKRRGGELNPESTLEPTLDALNVKKFDLAFAVDPLFHKTSAQFDEGGAHGLLLNNLSVYQGCSIVFDSMDIPDEAVDSKHDVICREESSACIRGEVDAMVSCLDELASARIAPVLDDITNIASVSRTTTGPPIEDIIKKAQDAAESSAHVMLDDMNVFGTREVSHDVPEHDIIDSAIYDGGDADDQYEGGDDYYQHQIGNENPIGLEEEAIQWLVEAGSGTLETQKNTSWTGASHWKYRSTPETTSASSSSTRTTSRQRNVPEPLDFTVLLEIEAPTIAMDRSKRRKKASSHKKNDSLKESKTLLPEDYKYSASMLGRYCLRPGFISLLRSRHVSGYQGDGGDFHHDDGMFAGDSFGDDADWGGNPDTDLELAQASHKVEQVEVSYCKAAKQVDVKALKELMWAGIQHTVQQRKEEGVPDPYNGIEFSRVLSTVPEDNHAGRLEDLSVHLCFICVLHLANEHGLVVQGAPELNQLIIGNVPE